jgi:two-component system, cell cycle sensor histidine kinase and response regulator CckA
MHALLRRQLKRLFGDVDRVPPEFQPILAVVDQTYTEADADRGMLERSLELSSHEMLQLNAQMRALVNDLEHRVEERTAELVRVNEALRHEIDERKRVQDERDALRQSQKMEAVGRLAGGVAHDFNNLLTVITGYTDLLQMRFAEGSPSWETLQDIRFASDRASALTRQLLAFSRRQLLQPQTVAVNQMVADIQHMLERLMGEQIALETKLAPDAWMVRTDPSQIDQVLINLVLNARDAMPLGGRLLIETSNVEVGREREGIAPDVHDGAYVVLAVSDTGQGMDEQVQSRLFEPFFTTKEVGTGTGLGLATVYGIVKQSGGYISVRSAPGQGSTFTIYLPRVQEPAPAPREPVTASPRHGTETILLVEDEERVRRLARLVLQRAGYTVLDAANCTDAVRASRAHDGSIALLLTDVVMPDGTGPSVADRLAASRPDMKVLFMSGYADHASLRGHECALRHAFLQKPFTPSALVIKVRSVLDAAEQH